jgi:histo-blood group ABO system transferase
MCTGRYIEFAQALVETARRYFCNGHHVTYVLFTDALIPSHDDIVVVYQKRMGWPYDTLKRFHAYLGAEELLKTMDFVFCCDADMVLTDYIGDEILGKLVGTMHPGYVGRLGPYERSIWSSALVRPLEGKYYFAGGFYGGSSVEVLKLLKTLVKNVDNDLEKNFIAIWHDESHLNRYFITNPPSLVLSPSYCHPDNEARNYCKVPGSREFPFPPKLIARDKNHAAFQRK